MDHLFFRRQFLLSTRTIDSIPTSWLTTAIQATGQDWNLYTHPDLELTSASNTRFRLILLGYLLNPFEVHQNNRDILNDLATCEGFDQIIDRTNKLNGRFLLFHINSKDFRVINDASGFRELYYLNQHSEIHCGSTPDIIHHFIGAGASPDESVFTFFKSREYRQNSNTWVGHDTIYDQMKKLPPNFLLDLQKGSVSRFWPIESIQPHPLDGVADLASDFIKGCLKSGSLRKPLHLAVTAGWDSRLLLAASKDIKQEVMYYINSTDTLDKSHYDIEVPTRISEHLGFKLHILDIPQEVEDPQFREVFYKNNFRANDDLFNVFYYGFRNQFDETYTVSGSLAEGSARKYYYAPLIMKLNSTQLTRIVGFGNNPYARRKIRDWMEEAFPLCQKLGINVLDLYQIEHEASNWCSHTASEQDIVREEIRPLNSRYLISLFWSLKPKQRFLVFPEIYREMIARMWKEVLDFPVNPTRKMKFYTWLHRFGLDYFGFKCRALMKYIQRSISR